MLEIKITINDALQLLLERMKFELKMRQKLNRFAEESRLENLSFKELKSIVDASIFDTVFLLPIELIASETNLVSIISSTVHALSRILHREEFLLFNEKKAKRLIQPIVYHIKLQSNKNNFLNN